MNKQEQIELKELEELFLKRGKMYVDPKYKKMYPNHRFLFPTTRPGEIEAYKAAGYEIVYDTDGVASAGSDKPSTSSPVGSMVTIQSGCGALHVLMHAPEEIAKKVDKMIELQNKRQRSALGVIDGVKKGDSYGEINIK